MVTSSVFKSSISKRPLDLPVYPHARLYALHFQLLRHFAAEPLNRKSGELLWKELLMHGGARDPHRMLRALLGEAGDGGEAGVRAGIESMLRDMDISVPPFHE